MISQEDLNEDCPSDLPPPVESAVVDCDQNIEIQPPVTPLWIRLLPIIFLIPLWGRMISGAKEMSNASRHYTERIQQKSNKKLRKLTRK